MKRKHAVFINMAKMADYQKSRISECKLCSK